MVDLHKVYNLEWYQSLQRFDRWNERAMYAVLAHLDKAPKNVVDFGCGSGAMLKVAHNSGAAVCGIEVSPDILEYLEDSWLRQRIEPADLTVPLYLNERFDLALCVEVGEHLPEAAANTLCETLARHTADILVFTAAAPGQGGDGHINCQPQEYWRIKLQQFGLTYEESLTDHLRETWKWVTGPMFWLPQNLQVFGAE